MSGYIDAPNANLATPFLIANVVTYPWADKPGNGNVKNFALTYLVNEANSAAANVGDTSADAPSANFYEQSPIEKVGANVWRYTRMFSQLPATWFDGEQVIYTYPGLTSGSFFTYARYGARLPITVPKFATVNHAYFLSTNCPSANLQTVTVPTANGQPCNYIGLGSAQDNTTFTSPSTDPASWIISSDPNRLHGLLWEIVTKSVTGPNTFV